MKCVAYYITHRKSQSHLAIDDSKSPIHFLHLSLNHSFNTFSKNSKSENQEEEETDEIEEEKS